MLPEFYIRKQITQSQDTVKTQGQSPAAAPLASSRFGGEASEGSCRVGGWGITWASAVFMPSQWSSWLPGETNRHEPYFILHFPGKQRELTTTELVYLDENMCKYKSIFINFYLTEVVPSVLLWLGHHLLHISTVPGKLVRGIIRNDSPETENTWTAGFCTQAIIWYACREYNNEKCHKATSVES